MELKFYEAILRTGNRTEESVRQQAIKENWVGKTTDKEIKEIIESGNYFDGCQVAVGIDNFDKEKYALVFWNPKDDSKIQDAMYIMEQDELFGCYIDNKEEFDDLWAAGEYEPSGTICFSKAEVEIIGELGKGWTDLESLVK